MQSLSEATLGGGEGIGGEGRGGEGRVGMQSCQQTVAFVNIRSKNQATCST